MSLAPLRTAHLIRRATMGWVSVVLEPMTKMQPAFSISAMELVIAGWPKAAVKPCNVGLWHKSAQESTLLVPTTARANFCVR